MTEIKNIISTPIKLCGNVDYRTIKELSSKVARFDVSIKQARHIIKDIVNDVTGNKEQK